MNFVVILIASSILSFFLIGKRKKNYPIKAESTELDYLYSYRHALLKIRQIESELEDIFVSMDYYNTNTGRLFSPIEIVSIKHEIEQNLKQFIADYEQGEVPLFDFHVQLDSLLKQLDVLAFKLSVKKELTSMI
ncbi:hypothetical protein [Mucilaginibacter sp.]|uniref:hypothetical protein n=1 Tax=Mucilaginibacter sp. TaxID=1882438 RepID=UPI0025D02A40|nr:hypothetical protein [Mucilaginibacter sp.]